MPAGEDPFRQLVDSVQDYAIYVLDLDGIIRTWNAGAERIKGYKAAQIVGQPASVLYTPEENERGLVRHLLIQAAEQGRSASEGWRMRGDGTRIWADTVVTALHDHAGELYGYAVITRDLTEKLQQQEELRRSQDRSRRYFTAAISDALTGAYNRRYMMDHLRGALDRDEYSVSSLLLFDADHFKEVNDQHGHDAGDIVLRRIADVARQLSRDSDMLFRLGGDEFVLYLPGVNATGAAAIAERLRQAVAASATPGGRQVTISVGVAQFAKGDSLGDWVRKADVALYQAKQAGRNRIA
jgi:diguanylate cyclase (GGDEF)-like protein/PAS domain S-box-containing protein